MKILYRFDIVDCPSPSCKGSRTNHQSSPVVPDFVQLPKYLAATHALHVALYLYAPYLLQKLGVKEGPWFDFVRNRSVDDRSALQIHLWGVGAAFSQLLGYMAFAH
jgi:hypothetical protein